MTRKTRITALLAALVVAAAAGGTAWGVVAQSPEPASDPASVLPVEPDGGPGSTPLPVEPDGGPGSTPVLPVEPDGGPGSTPAAPVEGGLIAPDAHVPDAIDPLA